MWFLKFLLIVGIPLVMFLVLRPFKFGKNARGEAIIAKVFGGRIIMVLLVFVVSIILTLGFGTVKEGFEGVVVRFDEATGDVKHPGLYWVTPIVFKVVQIDTRLDEEEMTIAAATSDQQDVNMVVAVNYRVDPSAVVFLYSEYQRNFSTVLRKAIEFWAKDSSGHYTP
ncbi:hypothetical protein KKA53_05115, partial [Candidatus Dependentiae bacterium]|nr:hypothetical protein [Candidatus Dependentiae bacterium]